MIDEQLCVACGKTVAAHVPPDEKIKCAQQLAPQIVEHLGNRHHAALVGQGDRPPDDDEVAMATAELEDALDAILVGRLHA